MEYENKNEYNHIFSAYERMLLRDLEHIREAVRSENYAAAEQMLSSLIAETQENITR